MAIPSRQTLRLPVLKLGKTSGEVKLSDAVELVSDEFGLTAEERKQQVSSGSTTKIKNRVAWAVLELVQAGLLQRPKRGYLDFFE